MSSRDKHKKQDHKCTCKNYKEYEKNNGDYADEYGWMKYSCHNMPMHHMPMMPMYMMNPMYMYHCYYMMKSMMYHHMMYHMGMPGMGWPQLPNPVCACKTWYQTKPGDSMQKIAEMYNISLRRLMACNPWIKDPNGNYPGQCICIPYKKPIPFPCKCKEYYTAKSGDTMNKVAEKYNIPINTLIKCNPHISSTNQIRPGQKICIPMEAIVGVGEEMPMPSPQPMPMPEPRPQMYMYVDMEMKMHPNQSPMKQPTSNPTHNPMHQPMPTPAPMPISAEPDLLDENCFWYTVEPGDTMYKIAQKYNISLDELIAANPQIENPSVLYPGQKICIPQDNGMPMPPNNCKTIYTAQPGDTMYKIAQKYKISLDALIAANPQIDNPSIIYTGQKICIPINNQLPGCKEYYIVKPGDTMYTIAQKYNIDLDKLIAANPQIANPAVLYPGQKICIPE